MLKRPKFKDCFHVEFLESDHVFLFREDSYKVLSGATYKQVAALLDGTRTAVDLALMLAGQLSFPVIQHVLRRLEEQGCLTEGDGNEFSPQSAFLYALDVDSKEVRSQFSQAHVTLSAFGSVDVAPLRAALEDEGLSVVDAAGQFHVVVVEDYLQDELEEINRQALASGQPWMIVKLAGTKSWFGPLFRPGQTSCWACLAHRIRVNRQVEAFLARKQGIDGLIKTPRSALPTTVAVAVALMATEIVKWIAQGQNKRLENRLLTFDHLAMKLEEHVVIHRPQCPMCGDPTCEATAQPIRLSEAASKSSPTSLRSRSPEEVFEQYRHHISPITGVITGLQDSSWESNGLIYNFVASHYFPLMSDTVAGLRQSLQSHTGGKGASEAQAKMSAIGEAIERFSTCYWGGEPAVRATYSAMGARALHPRQCLSFSEHQYATRERWNREMTGSYHLVPQPFREDVEVDWTPVWSLTNQEFKHILSSICYYGHPDSRYFFNMLDSNGVAAGSTIEEAIVQGFGELVERDSVALWWYNRIGRPAVDLKSFKLPYLDHLQEFYHTLNREFWVLDITADLNIPAFASISRRTDSHVEDIIYGFGAHLNPEKALIQAVTEMNQCLPGVSTKNPDGTTQYQWAQRDAIDWWKAATVANQPYLLPDSSMPARRFSDYPRLASGSLKEHVALCVDIAKNAGLEMFVLDLTRPDIGMSVCRVTVPGLCHFWRRFGAARLYNVPVQLGWLNRPRAEAEMNAFSIFF